MKHPENIKVGLVLMLALMSVSTLDMLALDIAQGDYYFDNSKVKYSHVKMVVGNVTHEFTRVFDMTQDVKGGWWKATIDSPLYGLNYFTFVETDVPSGTYNTRLSTFLDSLSELNNSQLRRTSLKSQLIVDRSKSDKWIYYPLNDARLSDGYWRPDFSYTVTVSGTLPVVYLNTQNSATISSKEYYISGTLWIDDGFSSLGSEDEPLDIEVKGRGHWTWLHSDKKPYRLKFASKQSPLGLEKSRHFVLLAHNEDYSGYLRNTTGFTLSRLLNMPYTPTEVPVELVLNGEYQGLYFLCEKIRVESGRVDIMEQADMETIPENVTGGWLLELANDGVKVIEQHQNNDPANPLFTFIAQSPEQLSPVQRSYIHNLLFRADSCVYVSNKSDRGWESLLDIHTLARFYVIHEILENVESFSGSLYLYKDLGDEPLKFGPVWDFDNSYFQDKTTGDHFIYDYGTHYPFLWIKEIVKFPRFQHEVRLVWREFCENNILDQVIRHAWRWREMISQAEYHDYLRWPLYASSHGPEKPQEYLDLISKKVSWLNRKWGSGADINKDGVVTAADITAMYDYLLYGNEIYYIDVNGDGYFTANDIILLYEQLMGEFGNKSFHKNDP